MSLSILMGIALYQSVSILNIFFLVFQCITMTLMTMKLRAGWSPLSPAPLMLWVLPTTGKCFLVGVCGWMGVVCVCACHCVCVCVTGFFVCYVCALLCVHVFDCVTVCVCVIVCVCDCVWCVMSLCVCQSV